MSYLSSQTTSRQQLGQLCNSILERVRSTNYSFKSSITTILSVLTTLRRKLVEAKNVDNTIELQVRDADQNKGIENKETMTST